MTLEVKQIEVKKEENRVYNLSVADFHTYFVTDLQVFTHNTNCSPKEFDIVPYGEKAPGYEKHHGVMDVWAKNNIEGYKSRQAPTVVLTKEQHNATRSTFAKWRIEKTGSVTGKVDWTQVSPQEIQKLTNDMFDAANVPDSVRRQYYSEVNKYLYSIE